MLSQTPVFCSKQNETEKKQVRDYAQHICICVLSTPNHERPTGKEKHNDL